MDTEKQETLREDGHVRETEIGVMFALAKEHLGLPEAGRGQEGYSPPPRAFKGSMALLTPSFGTSGLQGCKKKNSVVLSHPSRGNLFQQP